jgi:hypothetical protein
MKLHVHQSYRNGQRYHAYTRDKSGKFLRFAKLFEGDEVLFIKRDWKYFRPFHFDVSDQDSQGYKIYQVILENGACIATINKYPRTVFVFDVKFDQSNARLYSVDEDLDSFHTIFNDLKLSPKGDLIGYDDIVYKGSLVDKYYFELQDLGVDLDQIDKTNFSIVWSEHPVEEIEYKRRYLQRKMREEMPKLVKKYGLEMTDLTIDSLTIHPTTPDDFNAEEIGHSDRQSQRLDAGGMALEGADASPVATDLELKSLVAYKDLNDQLLSLANLAPHRRGYAFQDFLYSLFEAHGINPRKSFRNRGEEIDGSFSLAGQNYLMEAKWEAKPSGVAALHTFEGKLGEKAAWARGLFISYAGFSSDGLFAFGRGKRTLCMDGQDLLDMLSRKLSLDQVLNAKALRAAETGLPFVSVRALF